MSTGEDSVGHGLLDIENETNFNLGDADVFIANVSPHDGGVEFILYVNWDSPLDVLVDMTALDPYEQFFPA
jgi:hypothetical protein